MGKVIHIIEDMGIGGAEKMVQHMALCLISAGHDAEVWCVKAGGPMYDALSAAGVKTRITGLPAGPAVLAVPGLAKALSRARPEIVHCHGFTASVLGRLAASAAGNIPKVFAHAHSLPEKLNSLRLARERFLIRKTTALVCCSKAVSEETGRLWGIPENKRRVLYNAAADFAPPDSLTAREALGIKAGSFVILCAASLREQKGHVILLDAAARMKKHGVEFTLLLAGDGQLRKELEHAAIKAGLAGEVRFAGCVKNIQPYYAACDVCVLPSIREGFGLTLVEAMAARKPVVGSTAGGIPEVIENGANGLLFDSGNAEALAAALTKLREQPALRESMGETGRAIYEKRFSTGALQKALLELYGWK